MMRGFRACGAQNCRQSISHSIRSGVRTTPSPILRLEGPCRQRGALLVAAAKKKKGGGQKKGGSLLGDIPAKKPVTVEPWAETDVIMHILLLVESYRQKVGKPIMEDVDITEIARTLWEAPFCLISQDVDGDAATIAYANKAALQVLDASWEDVVGQSCNVFAADDACVAGLKDTGLLQNHAAWLTSPNNSKCKLTDGTLWNIVGPTDELVGQAALFSSWEYEDGTTASVGQDPKKVPTPEELAAAEAAAQEQAQVVRRLKEEEGKTNQDPEVQAAVEELLRRKSVVAELQQLVMGKSEATAV